MATGLTRSPFAPIDKIEAVDKATVKITLKSLTPERIVVFHILPNVAGTIVTLATIQIGGLILLEASLGLLGLGKQAPDPSWGNMLSGEGRQYMQTAPWLAIVPGTAISITVLASNLCGDSARKYLDPRSRRIHKL